MYNDRIATIYGVENGFVVECREEKKEQKSSPKKDPCAISCCEYETKSYTAKNAAEVMAILKKQMDAKDTKAYDEEFAKAAKAK
jgi:hypothetical protein